MIRPDPFDVSVSLEHLWSWLNDRRATPKATVDAVVYSVQSRGVAALDEPANVERLSRCDADALAEIKRRIIKLGLVEYA